MPESDQTPDRFWRVEVSDQPTQSSSVWDVRAPEATAARLAVCSYASFLGGYPEQQILTPDHPRVNGGTSVNTNELEKPPYSLLFHPKWEKEEGEEEVPIVVLISAVYIEPVTASTPKEPTPDFRFNPKN